METHLIHLTDFCKSHKIEKTFILELQTYDLVSLQVRDKEQFIVLEELPKVEKLIRLYQDLNINREGIEAIYHLLERTQKMQSQIWALQQKLKRYEGG
ncbi:MAG: chaperone modulator CbpM [Maribacter sp.]